MGSFGQGIETKKSHAMLPRLLCWQLAGYYYPNCRVTYRLYIIRIVVSSIG